MFLTVSAHVVTNIYVGYFLCDGPKGLLLLQETAKQFAQRCHMFTGTREGFLRPRKSHQPLAHRMAFGNGIDRRRSLRSPSGEGFFDGSLQIFIFKWAVMTLAIDEECWCAVDAAADSAGKIGAHPCPVFSFFKRSLQIRWGKLQFLGKFQVEVTTQAILVFKEQVVHFPELPMGARELRRLRGGLGVRMTFVQREIPEYKAQALPEVLLDTA